MISIVISEKGGAERRERYELNEITIGRVKGNDVLLPKGNVSKRHARLIVRDGRYIVTDLKSTNGTYVNHRRITHATLVREGDRIYIGDFVLRIDGDGKVDPAASQEMTPDSSTGPRASYRVSSSGGVPAASAPPEVSVAPHYDVVSHFPIEHDPDESSPSLDVPGPPRIPAGFKPSQTGDGPALSEPHTSDSFTSRPSGPAALSSSITSEPVRSSSSHADLDGYRIRQETLATIVMAVEAAVGVDALSDASVPPPIVAKVEAALEEQLGKLADGSLPPGVERSHLDVAARLELLEKGPLGTLLDDEAITQVQVLERQVVVHRRGRRTRFEGFGFATDAGVARALLRVAKDASLSIPTGPYVELELGAGRSLFAVRPPVAAAGHMICIKRAGRTKATLESLVRSGAISRGMATLLGHCVASRANVLVAGPKNGGARDVVEALALAAPRRHRTVWLQEGDDAPVDALAIRLDGERTARDKALEAAARLEADHLIAPPLLGRDLTLLLDGVTRGAEGLVLRATAATLRHAVDRMATDVAGARAALSTQTAREWIGSSFDLGLEVTQLRDGRLRVVRLVEFRSSHEGTSLRDIFVFTYHRTAAGGSVEGAFYASGTVPRIVEDLAARGMPLDQSIFRRHPS
jgi:pilus assembly protein CpaF